MIIPKGKFVKTYPENSEYRAVTEQLTAKKFNGYIFVSTPIEDLDANGYLVFEKGVPVLAYYEHKDVLNCEHALKNIAKNFSMQNTVLQLHELTKHQIGICKMYVSCINKPGAAITALDIYKDVEPLPTSVDELLCVKLDGAMPKESMCNICKKQCTSSIADPTHMIAKRFIKNESMIIINRKLMNCKSAIKDVAKPQITTQATDPQLKELSSDDELEAFIKESMNSFKDQSSIILESIGLGHMKKNKSEH